MPFFFSRNSDLNSALNSASFCMSTLRHSRFFKMLFCAPGRGSFPAGGAASLLERRCSLASVEKPRAPRAIDCRAIKGFFLKPTSRCEKYCFAESREPSSESPVRS